ncbi:hypothetical protein SALBM311S_11332 [Streptomyces alboniger]
MTRPSATDSFTWWPAEWTRASGRPSSPRSTVIVWPLRSVMPDNQASPSPPGSLPDGAVKWKIRPLSGSVTV